MKCKLELFGNIARMDNNRMFKSVVMGKMDITGKEDLIGSGLAISKSGVRKTYIS